MKQADVYEERHPARTSRRARPSSSATASRSISSSSSRTRTSTSSWWRRRAPATSSAASTSKGKGMPALIAVGQRPVRQGQEERARLGQGHRLDPRGRPPDHLQGRDRDRPLRRAGCPLRRRQRPRPGRLRDPGRGGLPARDGLFRVPARAEAHLRPDVRERHRRHALLHLRDRQVRRHHPRPRVINAAVKKEMKKILKEIQSGKFTREWVAEYKGGLKNYKKLLKKGEKHPIEKTGAPARPDALDDQEEHQGRPGQLLKRSHPRHPPKPARPGQAELAAGHLRARSGSRPNCSADRHDGRPAGGLVAGEKGRQGPVYRRTGGGLLRGEADVAIHSTKDLPGEMAPGLVLAGYLPRADPARRPDLRTGVRAPH
jgi:hypothetical protein